MRLVYILMMVASLFSFATAGNCITCNEVIGAPVIGSIEGKAGLEIMKEENGNFLYTVVVNGTWHYNSELAYKFGISENFSTIRGASSMIPNHHSWRTDFGVAYNMTRDLWLEWKWSNRILIKGNDNIFEDEFSKNRNIISIYTRF